MESANTGSELDQEEHHTDSIWTIANFITFSRVVAVFPFLWLLNRGHPLWATALLGYMGISDYLDGVVARHLRHVSKLGKVLDPICDRIALGVATTFLFIWGYLPAVLGVLLLVREILVSGGVILLGALGWPPLIKPTHAGKAATLLLMFGIPMFVVASSDLKTASAARFLAWVFAGPGTILYWVAAFQYASKAYEVRDQRRARSMRMLEEPR